MEENKYKDVLKGIIEIIRNAEHSDIGFASICTYIGDHCPELRESEDEKVRKQLLDFVQRYTLASYSDRDKWVAYLEKMKDFDKRLEQAYKANREETFDYGYKAAKAEMGRPDDMDTRWKYAYDLIIAEEMYQMSMNDEMVEEAKTKALEALCKIGHIGDLLHLENLKDFDKQLEDAYKTADEVQYKRGYEDGYLEGIVNAKKELEKQGEQSKEVTYTHEVETGNGNIKALVTEKVQIPKFKVGDKVRMKEFESFPHICTVEDVDSDVYYCDFTNFDIDDQDGWELVKEPKFKVGDFIVNDYCMGRVVEITNDAYLLDTGQGIPFSCEHNARLWSISDAKDGDVLSNGKMIVIFKHLEEPSYRQHIVAYIGLDNSGRIQVTDGHWELGIDKAKPATKEQRELLFRKMEEAGYVWNPVTKELSQISVTKKSDKDKKMEFSPDELLEEAYQQQAEDLIDMVAEKSAWNEDDEKNLQGVIDEIQANKSNAPEYDLKTYDKFLSWLKSIKDRVQPQPKQVGWSEEDKEMRDLIDGISCHNDDVDYETHKKLLDWLLTLEQRLS